MGDGHFHDATSGRIITCIYLISTEGVVGRLRGISRFRRAPGDMAKRDAELVFMERLEDRTGGTWLKPDRMSDHAHALVFVWSDLVLRDFLPKAAMRVMPYLDPIPGGQIKFELETRIGRIDVIEEIEEVSLRVFVRDSPNAQDHQAVIALRHLAGARHTNVDDDEIELGPDERAAFDAMLGDLNRRLSLAILAGIEARALPGHDWDSAEELELD